MPIKIDFLANVRDFLRGTSSVDDALDDVSDSLDDVAKHGTKATDKVEDSFRDLARRARDTSRDLDDVGTSGSRGLTKFGEKGKEVSGEFRQNLGETISSFKGDLADVAQVGQDTLGGLAASGLGGIPGLVATAVGGVGLGLLSAAFAGIGQQQQQLKEDAKEWAQAYVESGGRVLTSAVIIAKAQDLLTNKFDDVQKNAKLWGVSVETATAAMAGSKTAIDDVQSSINGMNDAYRKSIEGGAQAHDAYGNLNTDLFTQEKAARDAQGALDSVTGAMELGQKSADAYSFFLRDLADNTEGATRKVDEFGDTVVSLPDGHEIYIDAETGQATDDTDAIQRKIFGLKGTTVPINVAVNERSYQALLARIRRESPTLYVQIASRGARKIE